MVAAAIASEASSSAFEPAAVLRTAAARLGSTPKVVVVFSGKRGTGDAAREQLLRERFDFPVVLVEAAGVITSAGEHEAGGVAAFALGTDAIDVDVQPLPNDPSAARKIIGAVAVDAVLLWLIVSPPLYGPDVVAATSDARGVVLGGGAARVFVSPKTALNTVAPEGGVLVSVRSRKLRAAQVASPAVKILTPWRAVDEVSGNFLVSAGGQPVLEWFTAVPGTQTEGSPTFIAMRAKNTDDPPLLQSIAGMDPRKGAVAVRESIEKGREIAVGVWNGEAARQDLAARIGVLSRSLGGGVPAAGFFMTCLGRGHDLFGARDVDANALRARFGGMPFAGMFSQFEIARFDGTPRVHVYTASIAVLFRPS